MSDDVKELQLLPCPFCGGQPELCELGEDEPDNAGGWVVQCVGCQASSRVHFSVKEDARPHVISAWNARTAADEAAEVERLREALDEALCWGNPGHPETNCWQHGERPTETLITGLKVCKHRGCALIRAALSPPPTDSTTFPTPSVPGNHLLSGPEEG
jgi:Lar family restriction alleviation protein